MDTLRGIEDEVRKAFGVEIDDIVGGSIHRFHKDAARRAHPALAPGPAAPGRVHLRQGDPVSPRINGLFAAGDAILGYIVTWE